MKAIVLSGGGGKGAYQIGVWKALRKLKYDYKIVTGTSIGAINGLMMVQNKFYTSYYMWKNIDSARMIGRDFKETQYIEYVKNFLKSGGVSTKGVEKLVKKLYNRNKFVKSDIDFGIITYNFSKLKPCIKRKTELLNEDVCKYIVASATCFPAFKMTDIDGEKYIDGGYYDYFPINLAIDMGATEIIAVDLDSIGLRRKVKNENVQITYIKPNNEISNFLEFDKHKTRRDIKYGYNDTMKKFGRLSGINYTFCSNDISDELYNDIIEINNNIFDGDIRITNFKLSKYLKSLKNKEQTQILFDEILEYLLKKYKYDDSQIYDAKKVAKKIYKKIMQSKNNKQFRILNNIFNEEYKIAYIYNLIINKKYSEIRKITNTMYREFTCALYLYYIKR